MTEQIIKRRRLLHPHTRVRRIYAQIFYLNIQRKTLLEKVEYHFNNIEINCECKEKLLSDQNK